MANRAETVTSAASAGLPNAFAGYPLDPDYVYGTAFDECFDADGGGVRDMYSNLATKLSSLSVEALASRSAALDLTMRTQGITFTVHDGGTDAGDTERTMPLDLVPRLIDAESWTRLSAGLSQRLRALNAFLADVYGDREILRDRVIPTSLVLTAKNFARQVSGVRAPGDLWIHVYGPDLIRDSAGRWMVLEDNCRTPSGVSYVIENRAAMLRAFPELFGQYRVHPVDHYPQLLLDVLSSTAPRSDSQPCVVVLTPGSFNSAYFEHTFLARQMGVEIVEGNDLFVDDTVVYMKTTRGRQRVDVIYRRVDDDFLDPLEFQHDSLLGVTGLMSAYRAGNVSLANAVGTGLADDKAIFPYVPAMIEYYLGEKPTLDQVPTFQCRRPDELAFVVDNLDTLVVKPVAASGGYGITIGPQSTDAELERCRAQLLANPAAFIAQNTITLSVHPTLIDGSQFRPRHLDLRPFLLRGLDSVQMIPGGLSRVALPEGSLVVNSSQGGGSKDTWVLQDSRDEVV